MRNDPSTTASRRLQIESFESFIEVYERYFPIMVPYARIFGMAERMARVFYLNSLMGMAVVQDPPATDSNIRAYFYRDIRAAVLRWKKCLTPPVFFFAWETWLDKELGLGRRVSDTVTRSRLDEFIISTQLNWFMSQELILEMIVLGRSQANVAGKLGIDHCKIEQERGGLIQLLGLLLEYDVAGDNV